MHLDARWTETPHHAPAVDTARCIYEGGIPDFVEAGLESLYACPMTTLLRFSQYYPIDDAAVYVSWEGGQPRAIIVFRVEGKAVRVYNEQIAIPANEMEGFARAVFLRYPEVRRISLYAVESCTRDLAFVHHSLSCLERITIALPQTQAAYDASLSKNMSSKIKRSSRRLCADFPRIRKQVAPPGETPVETIYQIIALNRMRMTAKGQACYHTDEETAKLIDMVDRYGLVGTVSIDEELRAGVIMLRIGASVSMHTIAHHPDFDRYNLGTLCCYDGIVHAIASGARRFEFGWGRFEYKYRLLGKHTDLFRIDIYRTPLALAGDLGTLCRRRIEAQRRTFKLWMAGPADDEGGLAKSARRTVDAARSIRKRFS